MIYGVYKWGKAEQHSRDDDYVARAGIRSKQVQRGVSMSLCAVGRLEDLCRVYARDDPVDVTTWTGLRGNAILPIRFETGIKRKRGDPPRTIGVRMHSASVLDSIDTTSLLQKGWVEVNGQNLRHTCDTGNCVEISVRFHSHMAVELRANLDRWVACIFRKTSGRRCALPLLLSAVSTEKDSGTLQLMTSPVRDSPPQRVHLSVPDVLCFALPEECVEQLCNIIASATSTMVLGFVSPRYGIHSLRRCIADAKERGVVITAFLESGDEPLWNEHSGILSITTVRTVLDTYLFGFQFVLIDCDDNNILETGAFWLSPQWPARSVPTVRTSSSITRSPAALREIVQQLARVSIAP